MSFGLTLFQDSMVNQHNYVKLGLGCADVSRALDRGVNGKKLDDLSQSVYEAIRQFTMWVIIVMCGLDSLLTILLNTGLW